jgi:hypothetical protein
VPALPKPSSARHRKGPSDRLLPAEGRQEPAPGLPAGNWSAETMEWWERVWASPPAAVWIDSDFDVVVRLAQIREAIARDPSKAALHAAATSLEDRLGLTPRARRAMNWRIADTTQATAEVRRIRIVDPPAV